MTARGGRGRAPSDVASGAAPLVAALLVAAPVLVGIGYAAAGSFGLAGVGAAGRLTTARLVAVAGDARTWASVVWTLRTAATATTLAVALGVVVAVVFRGTRAVDRVARALAIVPLPIPQVVAASSAVLILGQSGLLSRLGHAAGFVANPQAMPALVYDRWGIALVGALAWKEFPFLALVAGSTLGARGADAEEAARTLGAGPWAVFRRVTWPLLWRAMLPSVIAVFTFVAGSYEAAALIGPSDPLPLQSLIRERYGDLDLGGRGDAYVLTLLALGIAAAAVIAHEYAARTATRGD